MKRKTLAILTAAAMAAGSLSAGVCVYAADDATHIYVLTAPEDHGWTGSVATFAKEKVEEVRWNCFRNLQPCNDPDCNSGYGRSP